MRAEPVKEDGDRDEVPFSNGTSFDIWAYNVCGAGTGCVHDSDHGNPDVGPDKWCPLITLALMHVWPKEWPEENGSPSGCNEYEEAARELTEKDFQALTEADLAVLKLAAEMPPDNFDYTQLWDEDQK
jgi:hypothetical protein